MAVPFRLGSCVSCTVQKGWMRTTMALEYGNTDTYLTASREELVQAAERGMGGRGALVEATFRLIDKLDDQEKTTKRLNALLLVFTIVIAFGTLVLCLLGGVQIYYMLHPPGAPPTTTTASFVFDHIISVSVATIILALSLALFFVWFFHKIFPDKPSTTAMASSVASLIFIVLIGYALNNLFGLKRDRDTRLFGLQQQHLSQLRPVLKLESERLEEIAKEFHQQGLLVASEYPTTDPERIMQRVEPDVMSPDLSNHYSEYTTAKAALEAKIITHDKNFEDAIVLTLRESGFKDISWFTKRNLSITFVQQCMGLGPGFVLQVNPSGYSFSHFGGGQSAGGGPAALAGVQELVSADRRYKNFRPSQELRNRCKILQTSSHDIESSAENLSRQALLLAQRTTLQGPCSFIKLE